MDKHHHKMPTRPIRVLYCDDEQAQRERFKNIHDGTEFKVDTEADIDRLPRHLAQASELPDILVVDLFHPFVETDSKELDRVINEVNVTMRQINDLMIKARTQTSHLFAPRAISILKEIRKNPKLATLPVLLYTRYGICTVNEEEMKEAISLSADWLLKGRTPETERLMMYRIVQEHCTKNALPRDTKLAVWSSIFSAILGAILGWALSKF